jgi:hypothetical protein
VAVAVTVAITGVVCPMTLELGLPSLPHATKKYLDKRNRREPRDKHCCAPRRSARTRASRTQKRPHARGSLGLALNRSPGQPHSWLAVCCNGVEACSLKHPLPPSRGPRVPWLVPRSTTSLQLPPTAAHFPPRVRVICMAAQPRPTTRINATMRGEAGDKE